MFRKYESEESESSPEAWRYFDSFIHIKDALLVNSQIFAALSMPWRGKLSSVDGFSFGALVIPKQS